MTSSQLTFIVLYTVYFHLASGQSRPADMTVRKGEQAMFNCSGSSVKWFRMETESSSPFRLQSRKIFSSPNTWFPSSAVTSKFNIMGTYNLIVKNTDPYSDGGTYQCDTDTVITYIPEADLVILDDVSVMVSPSDQQLSRGMTIEIMCSVGYGGPNILNPSQEPRFSVLLGSISLQRGLHVVYFPPRDDSRYHRKTVRVNYTLSAATPVLTVNCSVMSMSTAVSRDIQLHMHVPLPTETSAAVEPASYSVPVSDTSEYFQTTKTTKTTHVSDFSSATSFHVARSSSPGAKSSGHEKRGSEMTSTYADLDVNTRTPSDVMTSEYASIQRNDDVNKSRDYYNVQT